MRDDREMFRWTYDDGQKVPRWNTRKRLDTTVAWLRTWEPTYRPDDELAADYAPKADRTYGRDEQNSPRNTWAQDDAGAIATGTSRVLKNRPV